MGRHTEEELFEMGLTDEEREALLDGEEEETDEEEADDAGVDDPEADDDGSGADDDAGTDGDDGDSSEETEADDADGEGAEEDAGDEGGEQKAAAQTVPLLPDSDIGDADQRLSEIAEAKDKLIEQFDDGDLTAREYQQELDKLSKQEREVEQELFRARIKNELEEQQARNSWLETVNAFLADHPQYTQSQLMYQTLDTAVRQLAMQEENQSLTGREILSKAHGQIVEQFGLADREEEKPKAKAVKQRKTINAPPTLARVPAADMTETENTRWAKLDRLMETDPIAYEEAFNKLSDAERDAYLQAQ